MQTTHDHINTLNLFDSSDKILVALSGGKDSIALAHFLYENGYNIALAHVNFHLRGDESDADEAFVHMFAKSMGVPFHLHHCHFDGKGNLQDWARNERYTFFDEVKNSEGYTKVATGHHKDDQVETVVHNLLRGTGIKGVRGMMPERDGLIRPFLQTSRLEIEAYLKEYQLSFREDSSNASTKYVRNQIRHKLVPLISQIGENSLEKLYTSITHLQSDSIALSECINETISATNTGFIVDLSGFSNSAGATVLYHAIHHLGFNRKQCADLINGNHRAIIESNTFQATQSTDRIIVRKIGFQIPEVTMAGVGSYKLQANQIEIGVNEYAESEMPKSKSHVWMDRENFSFPLIYRTWTEHEKFQPIGSNYEVDISKYLKDKGIDRLSRLDVCVIVDSKNQVVWIPGIQLDDSVKCTPSTKSVITFELS
jgi:tRNA(Ile)-lysidine synthase